MNVPAKKLEVENLITKKKKINRNSQQKQQLLLPPRKPFLIWLTAGRTPRFSESFPNTDIAKGIQASPQFAKNVHNNTG